MKQIIHKDCKKCGQSKIPHRRMENGEDSPLICEGCEVNRKCLTKNL